MKTVQDFDFKDKKVIVRVDFNVPLDASFSVTDPTRIEAAMPTIRKIINDGGSVILMSHLGRPKSGPEEKYSLKHILSAVSEAVGKPVLFSPDCIGEKPKQMAQALAAGEILLLENLRFYKQETEGNADFARELASLADFYVNDAFGTAHRRHASTAVIADYFKGNCCLGLLMANEVNNLQKVLNHPEKPFTAIIGGAKVSSKLKIFKSLADKVDHFIVGGGMVYTFVKAKGGSVGISLVEEDMLEEARSIMDLCAARGIGFHLPADSVCKAEFQEDEPSEIHKTAVIPVGFMGLDIGPKAIEDFTEVITQSKTLLWNGPMGVFEFPSCQAGTKAVGEAVVKATRSGAYSLVGGGDSVAAVNKFNLEAGISYISTGGGAMLEFVEGITLPGIAALEANAV